MPVSVTEVVDVELTKEETLKLRETVILLKRTRNMLKPISVRKWKDSLDEVNEAIKGLYKVISNHGKWIPDEELEKYDEEEEDLDHEYDMMR